MAGDDEFQRTDYFGGIEQRNSLCVFALRLLSCDFVDRVLALQRRTIHEITRKRTKNKNTKIEELVSALAADV